MPIALLLAVMLASTCFLAAAIAQTRAEQELRGLFGSDAQARRISAVACGAAAAYAEREVRVDAFIRAVSRAGVGVVEAGPRTEWKRPARSVAALAQILADAMSADLEEKVHAIDVLDFLASAGLTLRPDHGDTTAAYGLLFGDVDRSADDPH